MTKDPRWPRFLRTLELFTNEQSVQLNVAETDRPVARRFFEWCAAEIGMPEPGMLQYGALQYGALQYGAFQVSKGSFFQVNRFLIERLVEEVTAAETGGTALDLYAGVGLFSVSLAQRFQKVIAVESGSGAVRDLEMNARRAGSDAEHRIVAHKTTVDEFLAGYADACDLVIADPPRAGLGKLAVRRLVACAPRRIVVVACDPATMARDLAPLIEAGYQLEKVVMIDLFPQTYHIETVAKLKRI
jgi:23S rRNA (uracil1939-C5)-methyltransferase